MTGSLMFLQCVTIGGCVLASMTLVAAMTAALVGEFGGSPLPGGSPAAPTTSAPRPPPNSPRPWPIHCRKR